MSVSSSAEKPAPEMASAMWLPQVSVLPVVVEKKRPTCGREGFGVGA
jgi:hypothetical protein